MNTYTLRCGEEVPIGVECALPPMGCEFAMRQWVRKLRKSMAGFLRGLPVFSPAIHDFQSRDMAVIAVFRPGLNSD